MDFSQAFEILAHRGGCSTCPLHEKPVGAREGQVLELGSEVPGTDPDALDTAADLSNGDPSAGQSLSASLSSMSFNELVLLALQCQNERTEAMRSFDRELDRLLEASDLEAYPALVAETTASFSVLSGTIRAVETELGTRNRSSEAKMLRRLQECEKEHLTVTAALHLDQMRQFRCRNRGGEDSSERELGMLAKSLEVCRDKRGDIRRQVQGVLEELRCELDEL